MIFVVFMAAILDLDNNKYNCAITNICIRFFDDQNVPIATKTMFLYWLRCKILSIERLGEFVGIESGHFENVIKAISFQDKIS